MQGLPIPSPVTQLDSNHRRDSSLGSVSPTRLSSSPGPAPVKLLNGRVYGSRRASEAAERERVRREENEPAFVEWGHGKSGGGIGSNAPKTAGKGFLDDEDDGSGMEWVRRRREERERRRLEQETGQVNAPLRSLSEGDRPIEPSEAPRTPAIQVSEYASPSLTHAIEVPTRVGEVQVRGQDVFVEGSDREEEGEGDGEVEEASSDEDEEDEEEAARWVYPSHGGFQVGRAGVIDGGRYMFAQG